jgi:hypothetical protein
VINRAADISVKPPPESSCIAHQYTVLLILTDGCIKDMVSAPRVILVLICMFYNVLNNRQLLCKDIDCFLNLNTGQHYRRDRQSIVPSTVCFNCWFRRVRRVLTPCHIDYSVCMFSQYACDASILNDMM